MMSSQRLVMKFGGASLASSQQFGSIANLIIHRLKEYPQIAIVVSAMGKTTDELIALAQTIHPNPPRREYDMLLTAGERVSMALLAMALSLKGYEAISYTGSQSGIITSSDHSEARIVEIRPKRIISSLNLGKIVIIAGFQGVSRTGEITTLGRGGSDTTAVALAASLGGNIVEFYKDVPGIFSKDPKLNPDATHFTHLSYSQALSIIQKGAQILHARSIQLAEKNQILLRVLSFKTDFNMEGPVLPGTEIGASTLKKQETPLYEEECLASLG